ALVVIFFMSNLLNVFGNCSTGRWGAAGVPRVAPDRERFDGPSSDTVGRGSARASGRRTRDEMTAGLSRNELVEVASLEVEMVARPDDADAKVRKRQLSSSFELRRVHEPDRLPAVDEGDASGADDLAKVAVHDERRVFVDPDAEELSVRC